MSDSKGPTPLKDEERNLLEMALRGLRCNRPQVDQTDIVVDDLEPSDE
jgi:hypothetical protein